MAVAHNTFTTSKCDTMSNRITIKTNDFTFIFIKKKEKRKETF